MFEGRGLTSEIQNFSFTFWVVVCEQLDVKLLGKCSEVGRHHAAGGQVDLVTAGLHLVWDTRGRAQGLAFGLFEESHLFSSLSVRTTSLLFPFALLFTYFLKF